MPLPAFLERLFSRTDASKDAAKNRLKLVLMHDRAAIPAAVLEQMRAELLAVLSKYVEIDQEALEVNLERSEGTIALLANVPILRVRPEPATPSGDVAEGDSTPAEPALA
ncbi:MAG: cell division topological specificity factor MinE [Cyanobacteria bacterium REEB65]|nr:cell division topological specificity factor MinE [Cyanobacteria bacterium REEB65]